MSQKKSSKLIGILAILIPVSIFVIVAIGGDDLSNPSNNRVSNKQVSTKLNVGDIGMLNNNNNSSDCSGVVVMAMSKKALDQLTKASVARDEYGYGEVIQSGNALVLSNCTKVRCIDKTFATTQVRILEGDNERVAGWVPFEFAIKN